MSSKGGGGDISMPSLEEYMPYLQADADFNRIDQTTPWGGVRWNDNPNTPQALSFEDWAAQNQAPTRTHSAGGELLPEWAQTGGATQKGYDEYLSDFTANNPNVKTPELYFSPEIQNLFTKQFTPDAYNQYGDDYMDNARRYLDPAFDYQTERFEQTMANRGQPVGAEGYEDGYNLMTDQQNKAYEDAAFTASQVGENARLQDFNRLMSAFGGSTVPVNPINTSGPANMALNVRSANQQNANQQSSNIWNTATGLGSAYIMSQNPYMAPFLNKGQ